MWRDVGTFLKRRLRELRASRWKVVSLQPRGSTRGSVLLSFVNEPFLLKPGQPVPNTHQHFGASLQMAEIFLELGYAVDVISWTNDVFLPRKEYAVLVDARRNLERIGPLLGDRCIKIMHIDTAHILFHNAAEAARLLALQQRRGVTLRPRRWEMPTLAIEHADCATIYGNKFTMDTYAYARKPLHPVPIVSPVEYLWPSAKDFEACRRNFLWFSSGGLVHKGLDLVLEVFAGMPDYHLTVCAPIQRERDFERAFSRELYELPNIHTVGWVDISSDEFVSIANRCVALVYPSSSEGQSGAVVTCLHAGLIPIVSYQSGVDVAGFGVVLGTCSLDEIREAVYNVSALPAAELQSMARAAWEFARSHHTRERFGQEYRGALLRIMAAHGHQSQAILAGDPVTGA